VENVGVVYVPSSMVATGYWFNCNRKSNQLLALWSWPLKSIAYYRSYLCTGTKTNRTAALVKI